MRSVVLFLCGSSLAVLSAVAAQSVLCVTADGIPLEVKPARHSAYPLNQTWPGYQRPISQTREDLFVQFEVSRPRLVSVALPDGAVAADVKIRPYGRKGLEVRDGHAVFEVCRAEQLVLEFGEEFPRIHVFADPPFVRRPVPGEIYFGPGEHDAGLICPTNGQTVCLDAGAVVYGAILLENVTNVTVTGRGILDSSRIVRTSTDGRYLRTLSREDRAALRDVTQFMCVGSENIRIEGIVLRDSPFWAMVFRGRSRNVVVDGVKIVGQWRYNSDGIDVCGCENVTVRNSFVRSFDDCLAVRDGGHDQWGRVPCRNVTCENSVLWCDWGFNAKVQLTGAPDALIENVAVTNCVFANVDSGGVILAARPGGRNGVVRNVRVEDVEYDFSARRYSHQLQRRENPDETFGFNPVQVSKLVQICNYGFNPEDVRNIELLFDGIFLRRIRAEGPYSYLRADVSLTASRELVRNLVAEDLPPRVRWTKKATIASDPTALRLPGWLDSGRLVANAGNVSRVGHVFEKAERGERIVVGALGGSITEGAGSQGGIRWSDGIADWFRVRFPNAKVIARNAGIGATGSRLGSLRLRRDLGEGLDFVTIDFSVNDLVDPECDEPMEGCVREALGDKGHPAVVLVGFGNSDGQSVQDRHLEIARHYDVPFLSIRDCVWPAVKSGHVSWSEWSGDNVHPNAKGHAIASALISGWLDRTLSDWRAGKCAEEGSVPTKRMFGDRFEYGRIFRPSDLTVKSAVGFSETVVGSRWKGGFSADKPGSRLVFEVTGPVITLLYWRQNGEYGRALVRVDGQERTVLDGWFEKTWGGYAAAETVWSGGGGRHVVELEVLSERAEKATGNCFQLCAVGVSGSSLADDADYLRRKFREDVTDPATGLGLAQLKVEAAKLAAELKDREPWCLVKAHLFEMICDKMAVGISSHDYFPAFACWSRRDRVLTGIIDRRIAEIDAKYSREAQAMVGRVTGSCLRHDYDHATPDWDEVLRLGFPGLKARLAASPTTNDFTRAMGIAIDAILRNVNRLAQLAETCPDRDSPRVRAERDALRQLANGAPRTTYEVMLLQQLFFVYGEHVDHLQVRTLGNWDRLMGPYYAADLAAGRLTREGFKDLLRHFWWQWGSIDNWWGQPVYIGGTKEDGSTEYNEVSRIVLEVHDELYLPTPKLQMKIAENTPDDIFEKALDMVRRHRSIVFCGEKPMAAAMKSMGFTDEDARTIELWGCYEYQPRARANTTLPCIINMPRIVQDLLEGARQGKVEADTFDAFFERFLASLRWRVGLSLDVVRSYEAHMDEFIPALVHSLSIGSCVRNGKNAIGDGMEHNLTVILQTGAGTAADALAAVKEIVYERREMTLAELGDVMSANWKGHEELRLRMLASRRKWGNDDPLTNRLEHDIYHAFGESVNGKPNSRNGRFFASGHSIDFFHILGGCTGATPDGRKAGEEFSKNISPAPGADREGPTALVNSIRSIDPADIPCDIILDLTIHPSLVQGEKGVASLRALVEQYFAVGGTAIHFNIYSAEELREAQHHPERYENLLIRVCGWSVRWNDLTRAQQDAHIRRCEGVTP